MQKNIRYLLSRQLCSDLVQDAFKLSSFSIMHLLKKENLSKLQNLLYFNIKDGLRTLHFMNEVIYNLTILLYYYNYYYYYYLLNDKGYFH